MSLAPGTIVGRYQIVDTLGSGGMAVVYRARDRELGRDVALKLLGSADDASQGNTRLLREAQALAQLSHPNVIPIYDVGRFSDGVFLAMELVEGERLDGWIRAKPRTLAEVLPIFCDAARGLNAAHARGIVHRDFKPSNVMLGSDGRVRVLDFGLARAADAKDAAPTPTPVTPRAPPPTRDTDAEKTSAEPRTETTVPLTGPPVEIPETPAPGDPAAPRQTLEISSSKSLLDSPLTQAGALVGTPPYMAPEQHDGRCDARSDQFSFCVAFWQALYGERPFTGLNFDDLKANMAAGRMRPVPAGRNVPSRIQRLLMRGLSARPEDRFASMEALLVELKRDPAARWRRVAAAGGVLFVAALGAFGWWRSLRVADACRAPERHLAGVWDAPRKEQLRAAFIATGAPFAGDSFRAVERAFDEYGRNFVAMHNDACEKRGEQSGELFDLRMQCLARRIDDLHALGDVFSSADEEVVMRAASVANTLPPLAACADAAQLRAPVPPPSDGKTRRRVEALRKQLAQVHALEVAGRAEKADAPARAAVVEAQSIGYRPALGEALLQRGRVEEMRGQYAAAERTLRDARLAAEAGRDDDTAALATIGLAWVVGERQGRYAEADDLGRDAQAKLERLGGSERLQAALSTKLSAIALEEGKYDVALAQAARAVELREKATPRDEPSFASALGDRADVLQQLGRYDDAVADYRRAIEMGERVFGAGHPAVGAMLINYAGTLRAQGKLDQASELYLRAQSIFERAYGPRHPQLATVAVNLGAIAAEKGNLDGARVEYRRAHDIWVKALGADHPSVATVDFRLGEVEMKRGRPAEAASYFQRALDAWEKKLGPMHPSLAAAHLGLGDALMAQHQPAAAAEHYRHALELLEKAVGPSHPDTAEARKALARALKQGDGSRKR